MEINKKNKYRNFTTPVVANAIGLILVFMLCSTLKNNIGYAFVFNMLEQNYDAITMHKDASLEDRYTMKLKNSYGIFKFIASKTPMDAVIYLPGEKAFKDNSNGMEFKGEPYNKGWAVRFLYPRKVVLESEYDNSEYSKDITHIIVVSGIGAEKLPYIVEDLPPFCVIPIGVVNQTDSVDLKDNSTNI